MPVYFLDTSTLVDRYCDGDHSRRVRRIVSDTRNSCYIADWTVVETASALASQCRKRSLGVRDFDRMNARFFTDISTGRLMVRNTTVREMMRSRELIRYAGVKRGRRLGTGDALLAVCCLELGLERGGDVVFLTADWTLYTILRDTNAYRAVLELRFFGSRKDSNIPAISRRLPSSL